MARAPSRPKSITTLNHEADTRPNIPTAEMADLAAMQEEMQPLAPVHYERARPLEEGEARDRDPDLDPQIVWNGVKITLTKDRIEELQQTGSIEIGDAQLVWRGKDRQDWSDLIVSAPMIHVQEKVHPKVIIDELVRQSKQAREDSSDAPDLFADFNGLTDPMARTEFYQHDQHWSNRMILGDSLQVMASLAEREALKGKVQAIYFDPPYGIKFNSNWQVSTQNPAVKDGKQQDISREPEQIKAFRDTWKDGIHSYLTYLRDRLTIMRELLTQSGSIFVQIGDENVHRVRSLLEEVFGAENFVNQIAFEKTSSSSTSGLAAISDYIVWFAKSKGDLKFRAPYRPKVLGEAGTTQYTWFDLGSGEDRRLNEDEIASNAADIDRSRVFACDNISSQRPPQGADVREFEYRGRTFKPGKGTFKTDANGLRRLARAARFRPIGNSLMYKRYLSDFDVVPIANYWQDVKMTGFSEEKTYVVQTGQKVIQRCLLMATDPGDLVLDPTCGSGTTAYVAEQWGRRWITIDTSRVALALTRARVMAARYPWYLLADSIEGRRKEAELTGKPLIESTVPMGDVRQGFVCARVPHLMLGDIARNAEIDVIWEKWEPELNRLRRELVILTGHELQEWEIPLDPDPSWAGDVKAVFRKFWEAHSARQKEIEQSIDRSADFERLFDKPYSDPNRIRVAGPFTVESLSPHRIVPADDELIHLADAAEGKSKPRGPLSDSETDFSAMVLDHLKTAGVHQVERNDRIEFTSITPWPGEYVAAEGRFMEGETERRAAIFIGPEFGTVSRVQLTAAAREAAEARFDVLIATAFSFDAFASELSRLGPLSVLKATMNPDLHMAGDLKNTGKGNLFTIFGEPDIEIIDQPDGKIVVKVLGVDIYDPNTGEVRSNDVKGIAAWFVDTAYNEESFFVRHAYFLGANDPYKQLKTSLRTEIDEDAWASLYSDTSRSFERPETGRIAVKVINHFGDEVMKVFGV